LIVESILNAKKNFGSKTSNIIVLLSFSNFESDQGFAYSVSLLIVSIAMFVMILRKHARTQKKMQDLQYRRSYPLTHLVFSEWNQHMLLPRDYLEKKTAFLAKSRFEIERTFLHDPENKANDDEDDSIAKVYALRLLASILYFGFIVAEWMISLYLLSDDGISASFNNSTVPWICEFVIGVILVVIGHLMSYLVVLITPLEKLKDGRHLHLSDGWKIFFARFILTVFNSYMFYMTNDMKLATSAEGTLLFGKNPYYLSTVYPCREDQLIFKFIGIISAEIVFSMFLMII
jgi:hypothetical protein